MSYNVSFPKNSPKFHSNYKRYIRFPKKGYFPVQIEL
jgi:hypothetical protein